MDLRTARSEHSIWRDVPEATFRTHLVSLEERTNAVPIEAQQFPLPDEIGSDTNGSAYVFTIQEEQGLANAFATLVAVEEGAQSVAAVCLEEDIQHKTLTVRFAAVDAINLSVQDSLHRMCKVLSRQDGHELELHLLRLVTRLHFRRILGRLRSSKWAKPTFLSRSHKKPLWRDFDNVIHRVQFLYNKRENTVRQVLEQQLKSLAQLYSSFEAFAAGSEEEFFHLVNMIRISYNDCTSADIRDYAGRLTSTGQTSQVRSALKTLRQVEKIAAYYKVSRTLVHASRRYPQYFQQGTVRLEYLPRFASLPTSIGYEDWAKTCHVHAEIQLAVHYDLVRYSKDESTAANAPSPRVIGTSKYLCYLCYLFLKYHGRYPTANTHGRLYDQWTIPDLADFGEQKRLKYRLVIQQMDEEIRNETLKPAAWRPEPMTSRENLLETGEDCC
jgi:hypothetical protein